MFSRWWKRHWFWDCSGTRATRFYTSTQSPSPSVHLTLPVAGAAVCLMGRREEVLKKAVQELEKDGIRCCFARGDVRQYESCEQAIAFCAQTLGHLDILVNCAAGNFISPVSLSRESDNRTHHYQCFTRAPIYNTDVCIPSHQVLSYHVRGTRSRFQKHTESCQGRHVIVTRTIMVRCP